MDRQQLQNAMNAMTDVAATINEYKRRKDLGKFSVIFRTSINDVKTSVSSQS